MSKSEEIASSEAREEQNAGSVYDFLYHDSRRIGSFISQFDANGLLTGLRHGESASKGTKRGYKIGVGGNLPVLGGGNFDFERGPSESGAESLERAYDPFWANALEFLDALEERNLIHRDIKTARIGQFVLVTGSLIIADLKMLEKVWQLPTVQKALTAGAMANQAEAERAALASANRHERLAVEAKKRKQRENKVPDELQMVLDILPHLPHSGQIHLVNEDVAVWAPASEGCLVGLMSDLILKHGPKIAGAWSMLGILDALPYESGEGMTALEMVQVGLTTDAIAKAALTLAPMIRMSLGRPLLSYGMTPLLVFREIAAD